MSNLYLTYYTSIIKGRLSVFTLDINIDSVSKICSPDGNFLNELPIPVIEDNTFKSNAEDIELISKLSVIGTLLVIASFKLSIKLWSDNGNLEATDVPPMLAFCATKLSNEPEES